MDTDQIHEIGDLRNLISGKPAPAKLELFTQPKLIEVQPLYAAQDVRKKDKEAVRKQSEFDKSEKARLLIKSKKNYAWKTYAPPEHQPVSSSPGYTRAGYR